MGKHPEARSEAPAKLALWQRIAADLRAAIASGRYAPGAQLPPERQLADLYGASRVTTRRALTALELDGLLRVEHGNGTFVAAEARVRYALGSDRVRFTGSLSTDRAGVGLRREMLGHRLHRADGDLARRLGLADGAPIISIETIGYAGDRPVVLVERSCDGERFAGLVDAFAATGSFTAALLRLGLADYRRLSTEITARLPTAREARLLAQSRLLPVLAYDAVDVDAEDGRPIAVMRGCFAGERALISIAES